MEVAIVGDIKLSEVMPLIEKYVGSLPKRSRTAPQLASLRHLHRQPGPLARTVEVETQTPQAVARAGFIEKHRAAMVDFLADYIAAQRYLSDPAHHDATVQLISDVTKQKPELFADWVFTAKDYFRDPAALPNLEALQANVDLAKNLGFVRALLDVAKYTDLSLAKEAAEKLPAAANH